MTPKGLKEPMNYRAVILDPIHKFIEVNNLEYMLLQTPFFSRLHKIKQLGFTYLVFPSAKHTRFEHSLGVMHLAGRMAERLLRKSANLILSRRSQKSERYFIEVARLAGLLHDIGHLPYSHNLEEPLHLAFLSPKDFNLTPSKINLEHLPNMKLHEIATSVFIDELIKVFEEQGGISVDLLKLAKASLFKDPKVPQDTFNELGLRDEIVSVISQIISHKVVDADRLDYLLRDAHATGVLFGYIDVDRLIDSLYLTETEKGVVISLDPKGLPAVEDAYDARFKMYRSVYYHHKNIALTLALTKLLPHLFASWDRLAPTVYDSCLPKPEDLFNLNHIASCISSSKMLFADVEFETMLLLASKEKGPLGRWSKPLLLRRDLIPISLIKRPDVLISMVLADLRRRNPDAEISSETLSKAFSNIYRSISDDLDKRIRSIIRASKDDLGIEILYRQIIEDSMEDILPGGYPSIYFKNLIESSRTPLLYVYVYGESVETHQKLVKRADEFRKLTEEVIVERTREFIINNT